jgi:hypothetical protein
VRTVILYSSGHLGSATILNRLISKGPYRIVGIVKTKPIPLSASGARKLKKHLRHVGWQFGWLLFWQQIIQWIAFGAAVLLPSTSRSLKPTWKLARDHSIPIHRASNINDTESQTFISDLEPDIIISAYFNQILKKSVLDLPKTGVLNVHPGWLPAYRGAMGYFWVLRNGSENGGVSVHWMGEGIDTGQLLARRVFTVTAVIGARLLKRIGLQLSHGARPAHLVVDDAEASDYYPMPGQNEFNSYFEERRFFRIRDIFGYLLR